MFDPDPQKLSIRNENIMHFQKSFFFFSHLLRTPPAIPWFSNLIMLYTFIQIFFCTLTPIIIHHIIEGETSFIEDAYYFVLHYNTSHLQFTTYNYMIFIHSLFLLVISGFLFFFFLAYTQGYRFSKAVGSIRCLMIIFSPANVAIPISIHISYALRSISLNNSSKVNLGFTIIIGIIVILAYLGLTLWASPLILRTPFLSMGHVPSPLLPDITHIELTIAYAFVVAAVLSSETHRSLYFFIAFSVVYGIFQFIIIWRRPYSSIFHTIFPLSLSLSMILNPLLSIIQIRTDHMTNVWYFSLSIGFFALFLIISFVIFAYRHNKALSLIQSGNFEHVKGNQLYFYVLISLLYGQITPALVDHIYNCYKEDQSNDLLIIYCYCFIITSDHLNLDVLDQPLTALSHVSALPWPKRFIVFELYRSFAQTMSLPIPVPQIEKVEKLVRKYWKKQGKFWKCQICGDVNKGLNYLHEMNDNFMMASHIYEELRQFYKHHPKMVQLELNFFLSRRRHFLQEPLLMPITNITCDIQQRYAQFIKRQLISTLQPEKDKQIANGDQSTAIITSRTQTIGTYGNTSQYGGTTATDLSEGRSIRQISNLHKYLERPLPAYFYLVVIITFLLFVATFTVLSYPIFGVISDAKFMSMIPKAFNRMREITLLWANINIGITHLSDCTEFVNISCEEVFQKMEIPFREPKGITCKTVKDIVDQLTQLSYQTLRELEKYSEIMEEFHSSPSIESLFRSWYEPIMMLFPDSYGKDPTELYDAKLDLRTALVLYTSQIILLDPDSYSGPKCNSPYANFTRASKDTFFNRSTSLQIYMYQSLQNFQNTIQTFRDDYTNHRNWYIYLIVAILIVLSIIAICLLVFIQESYLFHSLKTYFRPNKNPYTEKVVENLEQCDKFRFKWQRLLVPTLICLLIYFLFLIQFFFIYGLIIKTREEIANECEAIIEIGNVTLQTSLEIVSFLRYFENETDPVIYDNLMSMQRNLMNSLTLMNIATSPLKIDQLWNKDPLPVEAEKCLTTSETNFSIHDIESCWGLSKQASVFFFYFLTFMNQTGPKLIDSRVFRNAQHIYIVHLMDDFATYASNFNDFSEITNCSLLLYCMIEVGFYIVFLLLSLLYVVVWRVLCTSELDRQLNRLFQVLMPRFIASQQCLMDFIIKDKEEIDSRKAKVNNYFSLYDDADLSIIITTDKLVIVTFTHAVQTLFGYRAEQMIGQPLSILIPKSMSNNVSHNSSSFYQQLANMRKRQAEPVVTRDLLGRSSDGTELQLQVRASIAEVDDSDFFVIECKSLSDLFYYDMLIQQHKDDFEETLSMSMPRSLFPETVDTEQYTTIHYDKYILVYVIAPTAEAYSGLSAGMDLSDVKAKIESVVPYFDGSAGAIVLDISCSHACILFVDYSGDFLQLFNDAWQFLTTFISVDNSMKSGLMLKGGDKNIELNSGGNTGSFNIHLSTISLTRLSSSASIKNSANLMNDYNNSNKNNNDGVDIVMFTPPQPPADFANTQNPIEEAKKFIPTMTLEPLAPLFTDIPSLIQNIRPNQILLSEELCEFVEDVHFEPVTTELPYRLMSMEIATEPSLDNAE